MRPRGLSERLTLAVGLTVVGALIVITTAFSLLLGQRLDSDVSDRLHSRASAELSNVVVGDAGLRVREAANDGVLDAGLWVFQGSRVIEHPRAARDLQAAAARLARDGSGATTVGGVRLLAIPVVNDGRRLGSVVAAVSLAPYRRARNVALIGAVLFDLLMLIGALLLARVIVHRALRPVSEMTALAEDWSEHDPDQRFGLGPPHDELTQLGSTLDRLLERLAASVRHEQRFSAEVSHELRTPLARLRARAEIALHPGRTDAERQDALAAVLEQTDRITAVVDTLVTSAQSEAAPHLGTAQVAAVLASVTASCAPIAAERGVDLVTLDAPEIRVGTDLEIAAQILRPVVDNGLRYGRRRVTIDATVQDGKVCFAVRDDGPGISVQEATAIFDPGVRGSAAGGEPGSGLGLSLARRLARAAGGDVVGIAESSGGHVVVLLPAS